jgi:uncharacterized protein (DUF433 family)
MALQFEAEKIPLRVDELGAVRVGNTRVLLEIVITAYRMGSSAEGIVEQFPSLNLADVHAVLSYYLRHRADVDAYVQEVELEGERIRKEYEKQFGPQPTREQLLARYASKIRTMLAWPTLPSTYDQALRQAVDYILGRYHVNVLGIIVSGTIIQGRPDPTSDFDIYVIHARPQRQRVQKRFQGVPAEIFVNPPAAIRRYFEEEWDRPCTANMLANGFVVLDRDPVVEELRAEARQWLQKLPELSERQRVWHRYGVVDDFDNAKDIRESDPANASRILHGVVDQMIRYAFLAANRRLPRDKEMLARLGELDPKLGGLARDYYLAAETTVRFQLAEQIALHTVQETEFFEWESTLEDVPS